MPNALPSNGNGHVDLGELGTRQFGYLEVREKNEVGSQNIRAWPCRNLSLPIQQLYILKFYLSTRQLGITMKLSWIISATGVCANIYGSDTQQVLGGSVDLFGTAYTCENGMFSLTDLSICSSLHYKPGVKPSVTCTDPLSGQPNCSCTCTNGIAFNQTLPSTYQTDPISCPSNDDCQADKTQCLSHNDELKAQLDKQKQEYILREQDLKMELQKFQMTKFQYLGCYTNTNWKLLTARVTSNPYITIGICANVCAGWKYFGVSYNACYCDHEFRIATQNVPNSQCDRKCIGDERESCGGTGNMLSVFKYE